MNAIVAMPVTSAARCCKDCFLSCSLSRSGNTTTNAMWRNPPAVNGTIHDVFASVGQFNDINDNKYTYIAHYCLNDYTNLYVLCDEDNIKGKLWGPKPTI